MSASPLIEFTLTDADGEEVRYTVPMLDVEQGLQMLSRITGVLGGTLAPLLGAGASLVTNPGAGLADVLERDLGDIKTGEFSAQVRVTFLSQAPSALILDLVRPAIRNGKQLRDPNELNAAYRGNYPEALQAAWRIALGNGFLPQRSIKRIESALQAMRAMAVAAMDPTPSETSSTA